MSIYKDNKRGTWFVTVPYKDYLGRKKQKFKRGFKTQREAKAWERLFIDKISGQPTMLFSNFLDLYLEQLKEETKASTFDGRVYRVGKHIRPYFENFRLNEITSFNIKKWQNYINNKKTDKGEYLSDTYKNTIHRDLVAIFNHAKKFYNLNPSPCDNIKALGSKKPRPRQFFTIDNFRTFISYIDDEQIRLIFKMLFYTGVRIGELLALTFKDIDLDNKMIDINKTINKTKRVYNITKPKTLGSIRKVALPDNLVEDIKHYISKCYDTRENIMIFTINYEGVANRLRGVLAKHNDLPKVNIHSFRHSHVALLVELGANPLLIAERLGHSDIKMTLNTYAHLYPNKQKELAEKLSLL